MANFSDREDDIRRILIEQFTEEIVHKESELERIEDRIETAKLLLQRLRLGILAQHYGLAAFQPEPLDFSESTVGIQNTWETFEQNFLSEKQSTEKCSEEEREGEGVKEEGRREDEEEVKGEGEEVREEGEGGLGEERRGLAAEGTLEGVSVRMHSREPSVSVELEEEEGGERDGVCARCSDYKPSSLSGSKFRLKVDKQRVVANGAPAKEEPPKNNQFVKPVQSPTTSGQDVPPSLPPNPPSSPSTRFYSKRRVIIGNTSQYIDHKFRSSSDSSTHKWMVYVRGPSMAADISHFVKAVRFFLHPSYHPNDIVLVSKPPFHLTRLGWGEFPVRAQLEFVDRRNKPTDIIHNLVLDRTHTGQQTLGAETVVDLDVLGERRLIDAENVPTDNGTDEVVSGSFDSRSLEPSLGGKGDRTNVATVTRTELERQRTSREKPAETSESVGRDRAVGVAIGGVVGIVPPKQPLIVRHMSLPLSSQADSLFLDHDYCTSVVVSSRPRGAEPREEAGQIESESDNPIADDEMEEGGVGGVSPPLPLKVEHKPLVLTTNLDKCLQDVVRATPLWGPPTEEFAMAATSLAQYRGWGLGRRRASEWMRAVGVRRQLQRKLGISLLSTKQVLVWCRRNGYTPLDPALSEGPGFCKVCGCQLPPAVDEDTGEKEVECHDACLERLGVVVGEEEEEEDEEEGEGEGERASGSRLVRVRLSSASTPFDIFSDTISCGDTAPRDAVARLSEEDVDVERVELPVRHIPEPIPRFRIPQTPELKWVQQTAAMIGVRIYPAVIDRMYAHVVEHMLFMACSRFLRAILAQSVREAGREAVGEGCRERVMIPLHIYQAIQNLEFCDVLTNRNFALSPPDQTNSRE